MVQVVNKMKNFNLMKMTNFKITKERFLIDFSHNFLQTNYQTLELSANMTTMFLLMISFHVLIKIKLILVSKIN